ncbi:hypothetical protein LK542_14610 [Massilia sp. IC2-477]|uniref:hypothetical protein n=1 Tax=Massilia sp. IC2-477 TaxID=2887198 RepID=UPI001D10482F|nr:hypothetical protein [Massilia sp. IC2-477]MCC2956847.1 hypothetical protein [Massilia sp. IC2-477]
MRRSTLIQAVGQLAYALKASEIVNAIRVDHKTIGPILQALNAYSILASSFTDEARKIAQIFDLDRLHVPEAWSEILEGTSASARRSLYMQIQNVQRTLPQILALLTQDQPVASTSPDISSPKSKDSLSLLRVVLVEENEHFSTARRVIDALDACQEMYTALAALNDLHSVPLGIGAIDSGSDKSFDLFGAAELIKQLNQLILTIWDLVVFHKERKAGRSLELIANSLPILAEISQLEADGKLGREQAEIIRRGIVDGATKFLGTGTITEGMERISSTNPRVLMAPEPRLLTGPDPQPPVQHEESSYSRQTERDQKSELSDSELLRLAALLKRNSNDKASDGDDYSDGNSDGNQIE